MTDERLYEIIQNTINGVSEEIRAAENKLVFDKDNEQLIAFIQERKAKLQELNAERRELLFKA